MPLFELYIFASKLFEGYFLISCVHHTTYFGLCVPGHYCTLNLLGRKNKKERWIILARAMNYFNECPVLTHCTAL